MKETIVEDMFVYAYADLFTCCFGSLFVECQVFLQMIYCRMCENVSRSYMYQAFHMYANFALEDRRNRKETDLSRKLFKGSYGLEIAYCANRAMSLEFISLEKVGFAVFLPNFKRMLT